MGQLHEPVRELLWMGGDAKSPRLRVSVTMFCHASLVGITLTSLSTNARNALQEFKYISYRVIAWQLGIAIPNPTSYFSWRVHLLKPISLIPTQNRTSIYPSQNVFKETPFPPSTRPNSPFELLARRDHTPLIYWPTSSQPYHILSGVAAVSQSPLQEFHSTASAYRLVPLSSLSSYSTAGSW